MQRSQTGPTRIIWLDQLSARDIPIAGGKLARLGALAAAGFEIPRGFAIPVDSLAVLMPPEIAARIADDLAAAGSDMQAVERVARSARREITDRPVPEQLRESIGGAYEQLGDDIRTAVRSSGVGEDGESASFAGQYDTYLGIAGSEAVVGAVQRCFASQFTARALDYGRRQKIAPGAHAMAVGVLEMVPARVAGVAMTIDPIGRRDDQMVIEASFGLGEAIVSGQVTPDRWIIDKASRAVVDERAAQKEVWSAFDADSGEVVLQPMPSALRNALSLSSVERDLIVGAALLIEQLEGCAQDVEWAITGEGANSRLVLLQHRPETTMAIEQEPFDPVAYTMRNVLGVRDSS